MLSCLQECGEVLGRVGFANKRMLAPPPLPPRFTHMCAHTHAALDPGKLTAAASEDMASDFVIWGGGENSTVDNQREMTGEKFNFMAGEDEIGGGEGAPRGDVACIGVCGGDWRFEGCRVRA